MNQKKVSGRFLKDALAVNVIFKLNHSDITVLPGFRKSLQKCFVMVNLNSLDHICFFNPF